MRAITRKLVRDLWRIRSQAAAIAAVTAAGVAVSVLGLCNLETLSRSQQEFYRRSRFADVFVAVKRAPLAAAERLARVPGVAIVEPRVVGQVLLDMPDLAEPVAAQLVGRPVTRPALLNDLVLRAGRDLDRASPDDVLVSESFAAAHRLRPGSTLRAVVNSRRRTLRVAGIALSPEFIYAIRPGTLFPDDRRFGVLWMAHDQAASALGLEGAFNDALLRLEAGASESAVIDRVEPIVAAFGGTGAFGRREQISHWYLEGELSELRTTSRILPIVFAGVAAFLLNIVVSRLVALQREQIGLLRAFGYSSWAIGRHYAALALVIAAAGVAVGIPLGAWLGWMLSGLYVRFFHFPALLFRVPVQAVLVAAAGAAAVTTAGSLLAVRAALRLPPAEAMRPPAPPIYRPALAERLGFQAALPPWVRIVLRNVERRPGRALLSIAAIALAVAIMLLGRFTDAIEFIIETEFEVAQRQTATVAFVDPRPLSAARALATLPGVTAVEPFRTVPVTFHNGPWSHRGSISGVPRAPALARILDADRRPLRLPDAGLVVSEKLARLLHASSGSPLLVEFREGSRPVRSVVVAATVRDYLGTPAYMELSALNRLLHEGRTISGAHLAADPLLERRLFTRLKDTPGVAGFTLTRAVRRSIRQTIAESMATSFSFLVVLAGVIAFGVVYNGMRVALSERAWELATLRVIGFTRREIGLILLSEVALLLLIATPLGLALGQMLALAVSTAFDSEQYRIPAIFRRASYGFSTLVVFAAAVVSGGVVWRLLGRLDLIAVLKTRE